MSFYEGSARVPLIVRAPGLFEPGRVATAVSTMDLLPTLVGLVCAGSTPDVVGPLDGRSLLPHLFGAPDRDEVVAEYLAEGAIAPIVMIRRGRYKFIHSPADPDQLFDLESDPHERINLADDPASAEVVGRFRQEVAVRWDLAALDHEVRLSQQRRLAVARALGTGMQNPWDFSPPYDAARRYIRNHMDLGDLEEMARFPPVRGQAPSS
jgi:choline-sulfatase